MATLAAISEVQPGQQRLESGSSARMPVAGAAIAGGLAVLAVIIQGYHPYADDGGLYLAGIKRLLNPALYPQYTSFVLEPARLSMFARTVTALVRIGHLGLPATLLMLHLATIWATLFGAWLVSATCWQNTPARLGAVALLASWLSLPVAGTALDLMDPYLTARSFSTAFGMFALTGALWIGSCSPIERRRGVLVCVPALLLAAAMHPLMAAYTAVAVVLLACLCGAIRTPHAWSAGAICSGLIASSLAAHLLAPPENSAAIAAAISRTYWFPADWRWFELAGLIAPVAILLGYARADSQPADVAALARAAALLGLSATIVALLFAHPHGPSYLIARLQPLRGFHTVYLVMVLILGAELGQRYLRHSPLRWLSALLLLSFPMNLAQRSAYRHSPHLELRQSASLNPWVEAFLWIRDKTPNDAVFALDSEYINVAGEDAQTFRATAERSSVPDSSKDGGEASVAPDLAPAWLAGATAQKHLDDLVRLPPQPADAARQRALSETRADWLVLKASSPTRLVCPYTNSAVKVCRLPRSFTAKEKLPR